MGEDKFKLPGSSYPELTKIIISYSHQEKPASLDEISKLASLDKTIVSRNNGFLSSIGVVEGGQSKAPTTIGRQIGRALDYEHEDEIKECWKKIVESNEFLHKILIAIKIRKGMDESTLRGHIAYTAGQSKTAGVLTGARAVIDILLASGLAVDVDGQINIAKTENAELPDVININSHTQLEVNNSDNKILIKETKLGAINIALRINTTAQDLDNLAERLHKFLKDFADLQNSDN